MELQRIKALIDKYEAAETNLKEEQILKDYFKHGEIATELKPYATLFGYVAKARNLKMDKEIVLPATKKSYTWFSIAASIAVILGLFLYMGQLDTHQAALGSLEGSKEESLQKGLETMLMVSEIMNEGRQDLIYLKEFNNTTSKFIKAN